MASELDEPAATEAEAQLPPDEFYCDERQPPGEEAYFRKLWIRNQDIDWPLFWTEYDRVRKEKVKEGANFFTPWRIVRYVLSRNRRALVQKTGTPSQLSLSLAKSAFDQLPDGPTPADIHWVRTHPRLFLARQGIKPGVLEPTMLLVDDLEKASNGPAPSKYAAAMLQQALLKNTFAWTGGLSVAGLERTAEPEIQEPDEEAPQEQQQEPPPPPPDPFAVASDDEMRALLAARKPTAWTAAHS